MPTELIREFRNLGISLILSLYGHGQYFHPQSSQPAVYAYAIQNDTDVHMVEKCFYIIFFSDLLRTFHVLIEFESYPL